VSRENDGPVEMPVPYSVETEEAVIGLLLLDPNNIIKISEVLHAEDFYREALGQIFLCVDDLYHHRIPADALAVATALEDKGLLDIIGGYSELVRLVNTLPSTYNIRHHAGVVARYAELRRLIEAGGEIAALGYATDDELVIDKAASILTRVQRFRADEFKSSDTILSKYMEELLNGERLKGVPTGFTNIDAVTGGLRRSDLIVIAAPTSVGKTAFMGQIARNAAARGYAVGVVELEMKADQLMNRLLSMEAGVDSQRIAMGMLSKDEWKAVLEADSYLRMLPIYIDDTVALTVREVRSRVNRLMAEHEVDIVFIDYLQLLESTPETAKQNRVAQVTEMSRGLKVLAREIDRPIVALSQVNRELQKRRNHEVQLSDMRESGSIEMDADVLMALHREELYDPDTWKEGITEVLFLKHRNGPLTRVPLGWNAQTTSFTDLAYMKGWTR
jgi:replicative DNA helicase